MQGPYEELRGLAAAKRDKIIQAARAEYQAAVRRIKSLHAMVENDDRPAIGQPIRARERSLTDILKAELPKDKPFTIAEACAQLYENPATCRYAANSIRSQFRVLDSAGFIRKVGRRNGHILWVRAESKLDASPFGTMTLAEIAEKLIGEHGPMRTADIVARMKDAGYRPSEKQRATTTMLRRAMLRYSGRFVKDDKGRWSICVEHCA